MSLRIGFEIEDVPCLLSAKIVAITRALVRFKIQITFEMYAAELHNTQLAIRLNDSDLAAILKRCDSTSMKLVIDASAMIEGINFAVVKNDASQRCTISAPIRLKCHYA